MSDKDTLKKKWEDELRSRILAARAAGNESVYDVCRALGGADPGTVKRLMDEDAATSTITKTEAIQREAAARREASAFPLALPVEDPLNSQWWFTLNTVELVSQRAAQFAGGKQVGFIGAPTVAHYYQKRFNQGIAFDFDPHVVDALNSKSTGLAQQRDARDNSPMPSAKSCAAVVADPPWYLDLIRSFIRSARELIDEGFILCSLPSLLTRPGLVEERETLVSELTKVGFQFVGLDLNLLEYQVPPFEAHALRDVEDFAHKPWRRGDLLTLGVTRNTENLPLSSSSSAPHIERFSKNPEKLRFFLIAAREDPTLGRWIEPVPEFENEISTRRYDPEQISLWSSSKKGARIKNGIHIKTALETWQRRANASRHDVANELVRRGLSAHDARDITQQLQETFELWPEEESFNHRLTPQEIYDSRKRSTNLAATPSSREHEKDADDGFRLQFSRDRDRVLWSHGLKRLANKTQIFSFETDDNVRQRLAHSVEVMQLASTIGNSFGLDTDLIEAGALAHDIGHTPFGHAGEYALDRLLLALNDKSGGFNHYEHGVDVVRWLEDAYQSPSSEGFRGLDLTPEVSECIFKHTYCREGRALSQAALYKVSKHQDLFFDDGCHLEGQAVRAADKISYLISDLEDGIRLGTLNLEHLQSCRLFSRAPIDLTPVGDESLLERFLAQRRNVLKILMEDIILESERRLSRTRSKSEIQKNKDYLIDHSAEIKRDTSEIWEKLQKGILHKDPRVVSSNLLAARMVTELTLLFAALPHLIDPAFYRSHSYLKDSNYIKIYKNRFDDSLTLPKELIGTLHLDRMIDGPKAPTTVATHHLVMAKDYVASLTDMRARRLHRKLLSGEVI